MNMFQCDHNTTWYRLLGARLQAHWRFKVVAGAILAIGFFVPYFLLLYYPAFPVTEMPVSAIDRMIGFWSTSLLIYMSLWIYIPLAAWLLNDKQELIAYTKALGGLGMVGLVIFFLWPTSVPRPDIDVIEYPSFAMLIAIDEPRNVFPSLHAAFAVFSAIGIGRTLRRLSARRLIRILNICWCICILYSTLATKQHMVVDLIAGTTLGTIWAGLYLHYFAVRPTAVAIAPSGYQQPATSNHAVVIETMLKAEERLP